jgi:16S rRNA processing protein RimM
LKQYLQAGRIVGTHALRGEIRFEPWLDKPEAACNLTALFEVSSDIPVKRYEVEGARVHKSLALVKLKGIDGVQAAQAMKGRVLYANRKELLLPEGRRFIADLVGLDVYDRRMGRVIGKLAEVVPKPAHDVYVVRGGEREVLIPAVDAFLRGTTAGRIEVETIEGME